MDRVLEVALAEPDGEVVVGRLWTRMRGGRESASFEYDAGWLSHRASFAIDPELPLGAGQFHTERALFNAFTDPAPDRWGQTLLRRAERRRAQREGRAPRTLRSIDFLTLVDDHTRLGALRFRDAGATVYLTEGGTVPPLVELPLSVRTLAPRQRMTPTRSM